MARLDNILHVLVKDQKAGAETVVHRLVHGPSLNNKFAFKVLILSKFWNSTSDLFPQNTVSLTTAIFSSWTAIHTHLFWGGLFGRVLSALKPKTTWIHSLHYSSYDGLSFGKIRQWIDQNFIFNRADQIHIVSTACKAILKKMNAVTLIENYPEHFRGFFKKNEAAHLVKLLTVTFFRREKGLDRILQLALQLKNENISFLWTLCGDGPLFSEFSKNIQKLGLADCFKLVGYQSNLNSYYQEAHLYIQPSYSESFGLAVLDAIQYSTPVIASDVGHLRSLLKSGEFGSLIESTSAWANLAIEHVRSYKNNPDIYHARAQAGLQFYTHFIANYNAPEKWDRLYSRKTVVFCSPITTQATGGIQKQLFLQTQELSKIYNIVIIQRNDSDLKHSLIKWSHVQFRQSFYIEKFSSFGFIQRLNGIIFIVHGLWHISRLKNLKVIHALQMYSPTILAVIAKYFYNCRVVVKVTASGELGEVSQLKLLPFRKFRKKIFKSVDKFLALTQPMKNELIEFGLKSEQIEVVPNSVEMHLDGLNIAFVNEIFEILYIGRISTEKSLETLVKASVQLSVQFPQNIIHLKIVGGVYKSRNNYDELLELSAQAPPNLQIFFEGFQEDTADYYRKAHIFVLPSTSEGMSNSLLEALSFGLPCIVSDIPANLDLVTNEFNGLTFKVKNSEDLFQQMHRLYVDRIDNNSILSQRLSHTAQSFIQKNYSVTSVCQRLNETYQNQ